MPRFTDEKATIEHKLGEHCITHLITDYVSSDSNEFATSQL